MDYAEELQRLRREDANPKPPGWLMSMQAVRDFIMGDATRGIEQKFVGDQTMIERALVTLATQRSLLLIGEPGTAKSLLSELLAAAISGSSTLTIQGGAATNEDQIKYSWNYALLVAEGPSKRALVKAPIYRGMQEGRIVRFEEITRCPLEVQDCLLSMLSDRVMSINELEGDDASLFASPGFNVIATANVRDRGVNEMSGALKRRFHFETVFPIADFDQEYRLVQRETERQLAVAGIDLKADHDVLEILVTAFRDLRCGMTSEGRPIDRLSAPLSTAEAVSLSIGVHMRAHYLRQQLCAPADVAEGLLGTAVKDNAEDGERLQRYIEQVASSRKGNHWASFAAAGKNRELQGGKK
jgi:MoxR-like ATPase